MTIASAFNDIAVAQGGTAAKSGAITAAIDALNDALAGSDQPQAKTIEQAVRLLGEHIGGGGGASIGSPHMLPFFYNGTIADGADMEGKPNPIALITLMIGNSPLIEPNLGEWTQSARNPKVAEGVRMVIHDESLGTVDGIYTISVDGQTGKMTNVREVDCGKEYIKYDDLDCIALTMPQMSADEYLLIHYPEGD